MSKKSKRKERHSNKTNNKTDKIDNIPSAISQPESVISEKRTLTATFLSRVILTVCSLEMYIFCVLKISLNFTDMGEEFGTLLFLALITILMFIEILFPGNPSFSFCVIFAGSISTMVPFLFVINSITEMLGYEITDNDNAMWLMIITGIAIWFFNVYVGYKWQKERREQGYCMDQLNEILGIRK